MALICRAGRRLGQLARRLLAQVPELARLRLSSLDPAAIDADLWRLIAAEPRLMPHLHLSLQSGSGLILKRMKRRHSPARRRRGHRASAGGTARHRDRRRSDRRLPNRDGRPVSGNAGVRRGACPALAARLPVQRASWHPRRPHASGAEAGAQGTRGAVAGSRARRRRAAFFAGPVATGSCRSLAGSRATRDIRSISPPSGWLRRDHARRPAGGPGHRHLGRRVCLAEAA